MRIRTILCITNDVKTPEQIDALKFITQEYDEVYLLQVFPRFPAHCYKDPSFPSLEEVWHQQAELSISTIGESLNIPLSQQLIERGKARQIVRTLLQTIPFDSVYTSDTCYEADIYAYINKQWSQSLTRCYEYFLIQTNTVLSVISNWVKSIYSPRKSTWAEAPNPFYKLFTIGSQG